MESRTLRGVTASHLRIPACDGFAIAASRLMPAAASGLVLVAPATGVRRSLYLPFADHLVRRGLGVLTWDWRGTGDSRPRSLRGFEATMTDWATLDLGGVLAWAGERYPQLPLLVVGHSFGGQCIGLVPGADGLRALATVAAQSGYWGHWPWPRRYAYGLLWYVGMPLIARLWGRFPGSLFGIGEDLPRGVALEWARWCRRRDYLGDWQGHARLELPLLGIGFSDDRYAPRPAVDALLERYAAADVERWHVTPEEAGVASLGHFGFFKPGAPELWQRVSEWLEEAVRREA